MAELSLIIAFLGFALSVVVLVVFFIMGSNLGTAVKLLRAIHHELKEQNRLRKSNVEASSETKS